jgi:hypothetical protein
MNIYLPDNDVCPCAQYDWYQHVGKVMLESVRLRCSASKEKSFTTPYRPIHVRHPWALRVGKSYDGFRWFVTLSRALHKEYRRRFEKIKDHSSAGIIRQAEECQVPALGLTSFVQAMPDQYQETNDPVAAYRRFYGVEKSAFATWTKREAADRFVPESSSKVLVL